MKQMQRYQGAEGSVAPIFEPQSVAVIGSLRETWFGGYVVIKNLLDFGFPGKIYPINPVYDTVLDMKAYPSVMEVPEIIDLAVIMTSYRVVPQIIEQCAERKVKAAIIESDGFAERDAEGARLQQEIFRIARRAGLRLLGPNTIGVVNTDIGLVTNPYGIEYRRISPGSIAICGQTGLVGPQAWPLEDMHYKLSKICDFGNKCDVDETDLLDYLGNDPQTKVIAMHLEDIKDGNRFLAKVKEVIPKKPVLILKPGRTKESAEALASHTGSLAGEDRIYDSAFKQAGVIRVNNLRELLELPKVFADQPLPTGNRLAIVTFSGGVGVLGVDAAVESGLTMAKLSPETMEKLANIFPILAKNPTDMGPVMPIADNFASVYSEVIEIIANDDNVDCVAIVTFAGLGLSPVEVFSQLKKRISKPITVWLYSQSLTAIAEATRELDDLGFPVYSEWETAVKALGVAFQYSKARAELSLHREEP